MPTAEELKARFENRLRPGPTDERLAASLGLLPVVAEPQPADGPPASGQANGEEQRAKRTTGTAKSRRHSVRLVTPEGSASDAEETIDAAPAAVSAAEPKPAPPPADGGGGGLDAVTELFPPPPLLATAGPEPIKVGFPVPVGLIRDVTRLKVDLSRHLGRRLSNHEIGAAAARLVPTDPAEAAEQVRRRAERVGLTGPTGAPRRRLVAAIPHDVVSALEDLVLAIDSMENVRVTKSQLWALAHALLLERAAR